LRTEAVIGISIPRSHCQAMSAEDITDKGDLSVAVAILRVGRTTKML
jgi:hypothetical protein